MIQGVATSKPSTKPRQPPYTLPFGNCTLDSTFCGIVGYDELQRSGPLPGHSQNTKASSRR